MENSIYVTMFGKFTITEEGAAAFGYHCQGVRVANGDLKVSQTL